MGENKTRTKKIRLADAYDMAAAEG